MTHTHVQLCYHLGAPELRWRAVMEHRSASLEMPLASEVLLEGARDEDMTVCAFSELALEAGVSE